MALKEMSVADYIKMCNTIEHDVNELSTACKLRSLLKSENFGWQFRCAYSGDVLLTSSHSRFPTQECCKIDGLDHTADLNPGDECFLDIVSFTHDYEEIGRVLIVKDSVAKRKLPGKHQLSQSKMQNKKRGRMDFKCLYQDELGDDVVIRIIEQDGEYYIDLRVFRCELYGRYPTPKGLRISAQNMIHLLYQRERIQTEIDRLKARCEVDTRFLIGENVYCHFKSPYISLHLREMYVKAGELAFGKNGLILKIHQYAKLLKISKKMHEWIPGFSKMKPCYMNEDHQNQLGAAECKYCNYFGEEFE